MTGTHRALISGPMVGLGIIISIWGIVTWGQLPVMVQTTTKIEYKQADPPQEYSTGPVQAWMGWEDKPMRLVNISWRHLVESSV
jgi:hypothetical protein